MFASALLVAPAAAAYPQWTLGLTLGAGARLAPPADREVLVVAALRGEATFGPRTPYAWRAGLFGAVGTTDFVTLDLAAGAILHIPVSASLPLLLSAGAVADAAPTPGRLGVLGRLWWGSRSLNYHSSYGMAAGLWVEGRYRPGEGTADVLAGVDLDLRVLTLPFVMLAGWIQARTR
ncbi:MAG: uncharacterized protein JWM10_1633 [Myxococcaceae bacterium]|nr:uncharacterized protein [Myxococcaceae bacterium]